MALEPQFADHGARQLCSWVEWERACLSQKGAELTYIENGVPMPWPLIRPPPNPWTLIGPKGANVLYLLERSHSDWLKKMLLGIQMHGSCCTGKASVLLVGNNSRNTFAK